MTGPAAIDVIIEDEAWTAALPDAEALAAACLETAIRHDAGANGQAALLLADDAALKALNSRFRGKDAPTNVLSFPAEGAGGEGFLGDIALARETCEREAADRNISLRDHAAHLIVHGILHLLGYDHQSDAEADVMERKETEILSDLGVEDPYASAVERI